MRTRIRSIVLIRTVVLMSLLLLGIAGLPGGVRAATPEASPEAGPDCTADLGVVKSTKACVAVIHASPDAPAVDIWVSGEKLVENLGYGGNTGFMQLPAGTYDIQIAPTGVDPAAMSIPLEGIEVVAGKAYELAAVGPLAGMQVLVNEVTVTALDPSEIGIAQSRVRFIHAIADAPVVDVTLISGDIAEYAAEDLSFGMTGGYTEHMEGTYTLVIQTASDAAPVVTIEGFQIPGNKAVTYYITPAAEGPGLIVVGTALSTLPADAAATPTA